MKNELNLTLRLTEEEHKVLKSLIILELGLKKYSTSVRFSQKENRNILKDVKKQIEENLQNTFWK